MPVDGSVDYSNKLRNIQAVFSWVWKRYHEIPIIAATANNFRELAPYVHSGGFDLYLQKPVYRDDLYAAIQDFGYSLQPLPN